MKKTYVGMYIKNGICGRLLVGAKNFAEAQKKVIEALDKREYNIECCLILPITEGV